MEKNTFKIVNAEGKEIICDILFTFESQETNKNYVIYTDYSKDEKGNIQIFASIYDPTQESSELENIETKAEWNLIEAILDTLKDEITKKLAENVEERKNGQ